MVAMDIMVVMAIIIIVVMLVMFIMVIRTARKTKTNGQTGQTDQTFKLDFPGNLCRAAFAILAMFFTLKIIFSFLPLVLLRAFLGNSAPKQTFSSEG